MLRIHRFPYQWFIDNPPPPGFEGWNIHAFTAHVHAVLASEGFDLDRKVHTAWDRIKRDIVYWQETESLDFSSLN